MNKTILWVLVLVVVIVGIVLLGRGTTEEDTVPTGNETATLATPTGNVSDVVSSLMVEASADGESPIETDASLTAEDDWSGLDQVLDTSGIQ